MKTINLFLKAHFTSLSPDGQFISLAIIANVPKLYYSVDVDLRGDNESSDSFSKRAINENLGRPIDAFEEKSFYAEFGDFDINRCDDWVKENVISKLEYSDRRLNPNGMWSDMSFSGWGLNSDIKQWLIDWLSQFSDYKLNFIVDCGWFTWYKFVELLAEWEIKRKYKVVNVIKTEVGVRFIDASVSTEDGYLIPEAIDYKIGLPKLPANFPPVPQDLNELIALKKGISVSEAFGLDREEIASGIHSSILCSGGIVAEDGIHPDKFNALWDAKVTKSIWERLQ